MYNATINLYCPFLRFEANGKKFAILKNYFLCDEYGTVLASTFNGVVLVEWVKVPENGEYKIVKVIAEKPHLQMIFNIASDLNLIFF